MATDDVMEEEEVLKREVAELDEKTAELAEKFERIATIDCDFGACVFDPEMKETQEKIAEVQRRKKLLEGVISHLESLEE